MSNLRRPLASSMIPMVEMSWMASASRDIGWFAARQIACERLTRKRSVSAMPTTSMSVPTGGGDTISVTLMSLLDALRKSNVSLFHVASTRPEALRRPRAITASGEISSAASIFGARNQSLEGDFNILIASPFRTEMHMRPWMRCPKLWFRMPSTPTRAPICWRRSSRGVRDSA